MVPQFVTRSVQYVHNLFAPVPPRQLSGQWTQEERRQAVDDMFRLLTEKSTFPGASLFEFSLTAVDAAEAMGEEFMEAVRLINSGTPEEINARWSDLRARYGINAELSQQQADSANLERYGDM